MLLHIAAFLAQVPPSGGLLILGLLQRCPYGVGGEEFKDIFLHSDLVLSTFPLLTLLLPYLIPWVHNIAGTLCLRLLWQ